MSQKVNKAVTCRGCGQEWPRDPAYEVPCPVCRAGVGKPCMRPSEHTAWTIHPERDQAAMDAGKLQKCPKGKSAKAKEADELQGVLFAADADIAQATARPSEPASSRGARR